MVVYTVEYQLSLPSFLPSFLPFSQPWHQVSRPLFYVNDYMYYFNNDLFSTDINNID